MIGGREMNVNQKAKLHNKHHLILADAKTGVIKQEGFAYNTILNQGFTQLIQGVFGQPTHVGAIFDNASNSSAAWGNRTLIGSGTGAVSPSDTALGSMISNKANEYFERNYDMANLQASHTRKCVWNETEIQDTTITEVGLSYLASNTPMTRALIKDSEGNQISIIKGTTDILTIYSTVYIELSHSYGSNFKFVEGLVGNALLRAVANSPQLSLSAFYGIYNYVKVGRSKDAVDTTDPAVKSEISSIQFGVPSEITYDGALKKIVFGYPKTRLGTFLGNHADGVWEIGFSMCLRNGNGIPAAVAEYPVFRAIMPLAGVWSGSTITDEEMGEGTGSQTVFQTTWAPVLSGTDVVKVDGVTQTRGTDYTINLATGEITFATAPGTGAAVTCTYGIHQIPKDSNHVLDISFTIQFADGSV